ncbi:MAG TPA: transcriptional regulator [Candidatus Limnocylindria bacterium]|nr:transcriptional regulator [Candidatus Limnocylindria bacterium]
MIDQLFGSKTRVKLLQLFYSNPNRSFYVREITRKIDEQINSVRRELSNLLNIGIISSDDNKNRLYYEVNQTFEFYDPLRTIFGGGPADGTKAAAKAPASSAQAQDFKALGNVELVVYSGQFTRDDSSGIDILFVGDLNQTQLAKFIEDLEAKESKELRYTVMNPNEFKYRQQVNDRFLSLLLSSKKQVLVDKHNVLAPPKSKNTKPEEE